MSHNAGQQAPGMGRAASPRRVHGEEFCAVGMIVGDGGQSRAAKVGVSPRKIAAERSRAERVRRAVSVV